LTTGLSDKRYTAYGFWIPACAGMTRLAACAHERRWVA